MSVRFTLDTSAIEEMLRDAAGDLQEAIRPAAQAGRLGVTVGAPRDLTVQFPGCSTGTVALRSGPCPLGRGH